MPAPVQRGTTLKTATAPTSSTYLIDGKTFKYLPFADQVSNKDEAGCDVNELFQNPGHRVRFTGKLKSGQTRKLPGDLLPLTYDGGTVVTYVVEDGGADEDGYGEALKQEITAKKADAATYT
jgi:hypothetical protein